MNSALIDQVEYTGVECHFDHSYQDSNSFFMEIAVEKNDKVPTYIYPFGNDFFFSISVPSKNLSFSDNSILFEFDEPDRDGVATVYTGEHDGLIHVRALLEKKGADWQLEVHGMIELVNANKDFSISCIAKNFHGSVFQFLG